jgi:glyceraldehyde-3-phosphate dehydrogenase [NAD(P)+]
MGPLINHDALDKVRAKVDKALEQGATVVTGGSGEGLFHPATILDNVSPQMAIAREEIFGPVMPILTVGDDEEAIRIANDSEYGLDACVFTRDLDRAMSVAERLAAGSVSINAAPKHGLGHFPFGGNKKSGMGREGLGYSVDELTRLHTIIVART